MDHQNYDMMQAHLLRQAQFDKVWKNFVVDKKPKSVDSVCFASYGDPNVSCGCAIAVLASPEGRRALWQIECDLGHSVSCRTLYREHQEAFVACEIGDGNNLQFLADIQKCHDTPKLASFHEGIKTALTHLASRWNLEMQGA